MMLIQKSSKIKSISVIDNLAKNSYMKVLTKGSGNFTMRKFTIKPKGYTPLHNHKWEHEIYVLSGNGYLLHKKANLLKKTKLAAGIFAYILPFEMHQFINNSKKDFEFICVVPGKK